MGLYNKKRKFLFSHVSKCGGSSIISGLKSSAKQSIICPSHCGLDYIYKELISSKENPKKYIRISSVRNPWDRAVSLYYHLLGHEKRVLPVLNSKAEEINKVRFVGNFDDFIRNVMTDMPADYYRHFSHIIKFENLQQGFNTVCKDIGIKPSKLPVLNYKTGRPIDYRSMYNQSSADFIYNKYKSIIHTFSYQF